MTRSWATCLGNPRCTAASMRASITRNTYVGPVPETAVPSDPRSAMYTVQRFLSATDGEIGNVGSGIPDRWVDIARGPGRLASALDIDRRYDGIDLCRHGPLWLGSAMRAVGTIECSARIGISREIERKLRFFECDNAFVSGPRRPRTTRPSR